MGEHVPESTHLLSGCGTAQHHFRSGLPKSEPHQHGVSWKVSADTCCRDGHWLVLAGHLAVCNSNGSVAP